MKKLLLVVSLVSGVWAGVIPNDLQWPIKGKTVVDTSIFFNTEDAVDVPSNFYRARNCDVNGSRGGSMTHFDRHAGHDIIANYNTPVYPIYEGYIVRIGSGKIYKGGSWKNYVVIEHENNGKKWTSVYWHLQNKGLVKSKKSICHSLYHSNTKPECRVTKNTIIGYVDDTTGMNDVNHLHLGIRVNPYDAHKNSLSVKGFAKGKDLRGFVNPMKYLPHRPYSLIDDKKTVYKDSSWHGSNKLDMYSGVGYLESSKYGKGTIPFYNASIGFSANYKVYAKFPVSLNRSPRVLYLLAINDKVTNYKIVNQSDFNKRGHNVFLFNLNFKKNDKIVIVIYNLDKTGKKASSDALLFVRQWFEKRLIDFSMSQK